MSNNAPDYEDDLVFPPTITWTELVEWAKEIDGVEIYDNYCIIANDLEFFDTGDIYLHVDTYDIDGNLVIPCIAVNRTPEQMKIVLENLIKGTNDGKIQSNDC